MKRFYYKVLFIAEKILQKYCTKIKKDGYKTNFLLINNCITHFVQLACALASSKPIITIAYWEAVHLAIEESKELPVIEAFLPMIKENWLKVSPRLFLPNEKRRALFKGLSFVYFCARQYYTYAPLITAAGN